MLKTSISNRFTWGDVLDGMVDILPPREMEPITQTRGEGNPEFVLVNAAFRLLWTNGPHSCYISN